MTQQPNREEIVIYRAPDGALILPVKVERESVWLTQNQIAELFGVKKAAISKHISNIVNSHELELNQVVSKMETTAADGKNYLVNYYNLDIIVVK